MNIEIELTPVVAIEELIELAKLVDIPGVQRLGISDVVYFPIVISCKHSAQFTQFTPKLEAL